MDVRLVQASGSGRIHLRRVHHMCMCMYMYMYIGLWERCAERRASLPEALAARGAPSEAAVASVVTAAEASVHMGTCVREHVHAVVVV